jgi:hypothetical protein
VVAWACGRGFRPGAGRFARAAAVAGCAAAALPLAAQLATGRYDPDLQVKTANYYADVERCTVVKAAGAYVREQAVPGATVFHLSESMMLGVIGEFYYGLSYVGNNHTGERNRIVDFGTEAVKQRATPEQWAGAYGVPHFTYYVEFLPNADAFTAAAVERLESAGARVTLEVHDGDRRIGRVWKFESTSTQVMQRDEVSARWDKVGHLPQLFLQSLAGTAYHFGAVWPSPAPAVTR